MLPNFPISPGSSLGAALLNRGCSDFSDVLHLIRTLPYGRNSDRSRPELVLEERRGTCSSKHAFLKTVADEQGHPEIKLVMGLYKMHAGNTPGIGRVLEEAGLEYVPEAHCYLSHSGKRYDFTNPNSDILRIEGAILYETEIAPSQVGEWKVAEHRAFLSRWIQEKGLAMSLEEVWTLRERCIANLSA